MRVRRAWRRVGGMGGDGGDEIGVGGGDGDGCRSVGGVCVCVCVFQLAGGFSANIL